MRPSPTSTHIRWLLDSARYKHRRSLPEKPAAPSAGSDWQWNEHGCPHSACALQASEFAVKCQVCNLHPKLPDHGMRMASSYSLGHWASCPQAEHASNAYVCSFPRTLPKSLGLYDPGWPQATCLGMCVHGWPHPACAVTDPARCHQGPQAAA